MDSAFAWIGNIVEWLGRLIPRIEIVRATHAGVKFVRGRKVKKMPPGLHVYWPITTEVCQIPAARQTHNLCTQTLMTKDRQAIIIGVVVVYSITDIVQALSDNWDVSDTISDITQTAVVSVVATTDLEIILSTITEKVEHELTKATRERLKQYGVKVHKCAVTDFAPSQVIRVIADAPAAPAPIPLLQKPPG